VGLKCQITVSSRNKIHSSLIGGICDVIFGGSDDFSAYVGDMAIEQEKRVKSDQALYVFFEDIYNYYMNGKIKQDMFKVAQYEKKRVLFMAFGSIYAEWEIMTRGLRSSIPAAKSALIEHMRREPYFLEAKSANINGKTLWCYLFDADNKKIPTDLSNLIVALESQQHEFTSMG
jgi:hypothetical protein